MSGTTAPSVGSFEDVKLKDREKVIADYYRKELAEAKKRMACIEENLSVSEEKREKQADMIQKVKDECQKQTGLADSFKSMVYELIYALHIVNAEIMRSKNKKRRVCRRIRRHVATFDDSFFFFFDEVQNEPEEGSNDDEMVIDLDGFSKELVKPIVFVKYFLDQLINANKKGGDFFDFLERNFVDSLSAILDLLYVYCFGNRGVILSIQSTKLLPYIHNF